MATEPKHSQIEDRSHKTCNANHTAAPPTHNRRRKRNTLRLPRPQSHIPCGQPHAHYCPRCRRPRRCNPPEKRRAIENERDAPKEPALHEHRQFDLHPKLSLIVASTSKPTDTSFEWKANQPPSRQIKSTHAARSFPPPLPPFGLPFQHSLYLPHRRPLPWTTEQNPKTSA